jgi:hypothetical protein
MLKPYCERKGGVSGVAKRNGSEKRRTTLPKISGTASASRTVASAKLNQKERIKRRETHRRGGTGNPMRIWYERKKVSFRKEKKSTSAIKRTRPRAAKGERQYNREEGREREENLLRRKRRLLHCREGLFLAT